MPQYLLNLSGELGSSDNQKLLHTIKSVTQGDELVISMDSNDAHQADVIFRILDKNEFEYLPKGTGSGETYQIYARRK